MVISVRLDHNLDSRLDKLVSETHRSKSFYIKEALSEYLDNREDYLLALAAFEKEEPTTSLLEVRKELGLED